MVNVSVVFMNNISQSVLNNDVFVALLHCMPPQAVASPGVRGWGVKVEMV